MPSTRRLHRNSISGHANSGFTVVELLVSVAIIGLLIAVTLPAVQQVRESARGMQCSSNLHQIGVAVQAYEVSHRQLPDSGAGGVLFGILPYLEQQAAYERVMECRRRHDVNSMLAAVDNISVYICPSMSGPFGYHGGASYVMNVGLVSDLVGQQRAFLRQPMRWSQVTDGLSQTVFMSEVSSLTGIWQVQFSITNQIPMTIDSLNESADLCLQEWKTYLPDSAPSYQGTVLSGGAGYNHVLPPNSGWCLGGLPPFQIVPANSNHPTGVYAMTADGAVRFVSQTVDRSVWQAQGTIDGAETF